MATGTNWKRPWEEESESGQEYSSHTNRVGEQSSKPAVRTAPSDQDRGQPATSPRELRFVPPSNGTTIFSPSPSRRIDFLPKDTSGPQSPTRSRYPLSPPNKRPRLDCSKPQNIYCPRRRASESITDIFGTQGTGLGDAPRDAARQSEMGSFSSDTSSRDEKEKLDPRPGLEPTDGRESSETNTTPPKTQCETCMAARGIVQRVVKGVDRLHEQLVSVLTSDLVEHKRSLAIESPPEETLSSVPQRGLIPMLKWGLDKLENTVLIAQDIILSRVHISQTNRKGIEATDSALDTAKFADKAKGKWELEGRRGSQMFRCSSPPRDETHRSSDVSGCPSFPTEDQRRGFTRDMHTSQLPFSHHAMYTPSGPMLNQPHSPMQAPPPNRLLPSPSSMNFSSSSQILPPMSPSLLGSKSPHTAHLQELQHQLSTKSLAHQILQGEHDKLLAAFSRSQTRCATLDRKSQVSDTEINNLTEDRLRLQAQVDAYELQIEELQQSRDEAHKQSVASGGQYLQIMSMSSKLQVQAEADLKKWKADRQAWQQEKSELLSKIKILEQRTERPSSSETRADASGSCTIACQSGAAISSPKRGEDTSGDVLTSNSVEELRAEIVNLRRRRTDTEALLRAWRDDSAQVDEVLENLGVVGERMRKRSKGIGECGMGGC